MAYIGHPDVDPPRPWEVMDKEGTALIKAGVDDPLGLWLTAWAIWEAREGRTDASDFLARARRHKLLADHPATLRERREDLAHECKINNSSDATAKVHQERSKLILKAAADPAVYGPKDDEILFRDVDSAFSTTNARERPAELQKLCAPPHFTPWLREMLNGELQHRIASGHRGGGFAGKVSGDGWKKFAEHQVKAHAHFTKAWELRPDRADAAASMIDIVKCDNGPPGETTRLWFDRAVAAQFDHYDAYYQMLWALRPGWGGSLDEMQAFFFACALPERFESSLPLILRLALDYLEGDVRDIRTLLSRQPMKQVVVQVSRLLAESTDTYRAWQRPWRLADLGLMAWAAGDYETAHDTFSEVPVPFPCQTRRRLNLMANEAEVRAQSALAAFGMTAEWDAAEEIYASHRPDDALLAYQEMVARFQGEPPGLLLRRVAACKFEKAFATGQWVPLRASPDLAEWHHLSGFWTGLKSGTLVNNGHGGQAFLLHNGRTGSNFELMGEYEFKAKEDLSQGLGIILGYHSQRKSEDWITCAQWSVSKDGNVASMLRKFYQTHASKVVPPVNGSTWKFHIVCRNGVVTYRLNHSDVVADHRTAYKDGEIFEMPEDSVIGFFLHWFHEKSHTHVRRLSVRHLDSPDKVAEAEDALASLAALREGFARQCKRAVADLHAALEAEVDVLSGDFNRAHKEESLAKSETLLLRLKKPEPIKVAEMPVPAPGEEWLATLLRGYQASLESRLAMARAAWKEKAVSLRDTAESEEIAAFVSAELEPRPPAEVEEPLAPLNALKWQTQAGDWTRTPEAAHRQRRQLHAL